MKVSFQTMGSGRPKLVWLQISKKEIQLQQSEFSEIRTLATIPMDGKALEAALKSTRKDYFRGTVNYTNPSIRDGGLVRISTPLGDISEYGVFFSIEPGKWPQSIIRLKPLFDLSSQWLKQLKALEEKHSE